MIHSLSGGVIAPNEPHTFVKVQVAGEPRWYVLPFGKAEEGQDVLVPFGRDDRAMQGVVLRVETCTAQTAPVPLGRVKRVIRVLPVKTNDR